MRDIVTRKRWSAKDYIDIMLMDVIERDKSLQS
jgi:hypothetical protein